MLKLGVTVLFLFVCSIGCYSNDIDKQLAYDIGVENSDGSFSRGMHQYWVISEKRSFKKAEEVCRRKGIGGHLVSIEDDKENLFVSNLLRQANISLAGSRTGYDHNNLVYIGAKRDDDEWTWSDGSDFRYDNFHLSTDRASLPKCATLIPGVDIDNADHARWMEINCTDWTTHSICKAWTTDFAKRFLKAVLDPSQPIPEEIAEIITQAKEKLAKNNITASIFQELRKMDKAMEYIITKRSALSSRVLMCDNGWVRLESECYLMVNIAATYDDMKSHCQSMGATLASIHSKEKNNFLVDLNDRKYENHSSHLWVGARRPTPTGNFNKFDDGTDIGFTYWGHRQPDNANNNEHCLMVSHRDCPGWPCEAAHWNDARCDLRMRAVCQRRPHPHLPSVKECAKGWVKFENECYLMVNDVRSYDDSKAYCASMDATLASIHSKAKNDFLVVLNNKTFVEPVGGGQNHIWAGARRPTATGNFTKFDDGTSIDFSYWAPNQPDNGYENREHCMMVAHKDCPDMGYYQPGRWNDLICDWHLRSVCQRKL